MQKILNLLTCAMITLCLGFTSPAMAENETYGAAGSSQLTDEQLTLDKMLSFAIQDEYLARGEYQKIIEKFGNNRPFSNIIKAEERHIAWLKPLFEKFELVLPPDRGLELATIPATFAESLQIGAAAEVANIAMYKRFLKQQLPDNVREVFSHLLSASENHLAAFTRNGRGMGKGRQAQ